MVLRCGLCYRKIKGTEFIDKATAEKLYSSPACIKCLDCTEFLYGDIDNETICDYLRGLGLSEIRIKNLGWS